MIGGRKLKGAFTLFGSSIKPQRMMEAGGRIECACQIVKYNYVITSWTGKVRKKKPQRRVSEGKGCPVAKDLRRLSAQKKKVQKTLSRSLNS